jgi:hypothetical protein
MDVSRLNTIFGRRHSRRDAVKYTGMGIGAAALGASAIGASGFGMSAFAQDATPVAGDDSLGLPEGERTYTMFIQTAMAGTWVPKAGEEGVYTLTLTGLPAQTVYFSDRPERVVGTATTTEFLSALGFDPENAPNAALVTTDDAGEEDILVIELFNPAYTEGTGEEGATLVYEARILENYHDTGLGRVALQQDDTEIPSSFAGASLFIDDCADGVATCSVTGTNQVVGTKKFGCCWAVLTCQNCHPLADSLCNDVAGCEGGCEVGVSKNCLI